MAILYATEISGLAVSYYNSGNINKKYLDTISSNLSTRTGRVITWGTLTEGTGITPLTNIGVSGSGDHDVTVLGYLTISSNAKKGKASGSIVGAWYDASAQKYSKWYSSGSTLGKLDNWYIGSSQKLSKWKASSAQYGIVNNWYLNSSQKLSKWKSSSSTFGTLNNWYSNSSSKYSGWYTSGAKLGIAYDHSQDNTQAHSDYLLNNADDSTTGVLTAGGFITTAGISSTRISSSVIKGGEWKSAPMLFNVANIRLSSCQNINVARFTCPTGKKAYIWQASACGSGGYAVSGMFIQMLADTSLPLNGSDNVYKTSSQILKEGSPLGVSTAGAMVEIRLMYSGQQTFTGKGIKFGSGFMNVSVH